MNFFFIFITEKKSSLVIIKLTFNSFYFCFCYCFSENFPVTFQILKMVKTDKEYGGGAHF